MWACSCAGFIAARLAFSKCGILDTDNDNARILAGEYALNALACEAIFARDVFGALLPCVIGRDKLRAGDGVKDHVSGG